MTVDSDGSLPRCTPGQRVDGTPCRPSGPRSGHWRDRADAATGGPAPASARGRLDRHGDRGRRRPRPAGTTGIATARRPARPPRSPRAGRRRRAGGRPAPSRRRDAPRGAAAARRAARAVLAVRDDGRQPDAPATLRVVERGHVAARRVVEVRPAAGHPGAEVRADRPEDDDGPAGHVLAAVRADALDDRLGAGVADREAHPGPADDVQPAAGRAVQAGVAGDAPRTPASRRGRARARRRRPPDRPLPT